MAGWVRRLATTIALLLAVAAAITAAAVEEYEVAPGGGGAINPRRAARNGKSGRRRRAKNANSRAVKAAQSGDLQGSLPLFRQAVELAPHNPQYWNNLGVTFMRLQQYHSAEEAFLQGAEMDPENVDVKANMRDLSSYLPDMLPAPEPRKQQHTRRKFKRLTLADLELPRYERYREGQIPFVLTGALSHWQHAFESWSLDYFLDEYPGRSVEHYSRNMYLESVKPVFTPMDQAFADMTAQSTRYRHKPGVYVQWNLDKPMWDQMLADAAQGEPRVPSIFTHDDLWLSKCMEDPNIISEFLIGTHWRMLLIGSRGAGMFNHRDILRSSSFQAQVVGTKRWHLCAPSQDQYMYKAGDVDTFSPDYEQFPKARSANCIDDWVQPGEMLFYPRDYWHQTEVEKAEDGRPSISITGTLTDRNNYLSMEEELGKECSGATRRIHLTERVCKALTEKCFPLWHQLWDKP